MATSIRLERVTPRMSHRVVRRPKISPETRAVLEAVRACHDTTGWQKKDLLRGRANYVESFFGLLRALRDNGSTPAQLEGVLVAFYNAGRRLVLSLLPLGDCALADAVRREQEVQGKEDVAEIVALTQKSPGTLRHLRAIYLESIEAQREVVRVIDAELARMEASER